MVFAHSGRAAVTYRVEVGVCLASGDPVGDPRAWPQAIDAWLGLCQTYGWAPGVMGASSAGAQAYREAGLNALELGDEAILLTADFKLSGPDMRGVRQAVTRARRAGLTVRVRRHRDISADEMAELRVRAEISNLTSIVSEADLKGDAALGPSRRDAVASPVGHYRRLLGLDAPFSEIPERHHRAHGQRPRPER